MIVAGGLYTMGDVLMFILEKTESSLHKADPKWRIFFFNWNEIGTWAESFIVRHCRRLDNDPAG